MYIQTPGYTVSITTGKKRVDRNKTCKLQSVLFVKAIKLKTTNTILNFIQGLQEDINKSATYLHLLFFKSVSMRKPGRTRQGVIMLKSPISLKLGTNVRYQE